MAFSHTLKVDRGTTYALTVNYRENGVAASIAGSTIRFTVKASEFDSDDTDATALGGLKKTVTTHTNPAGGVSTIVLNPADSQDVTPGTYYYDVKIDRTSDGVTVYKLDEGSFVLDASPTNRLSL